MLQNHLRLILLSMVLIWGIPNIYPDGNFNLPRRPEYAELVQTMEQRLDANWRHALPPA